MLYLQNTTESQTIYVPKSGAVPAGVLRFKARNTTDLSVEVDRFVRDFRTSGLYFNVSVVLPAGIPDGEYEYTLSVGDAVLSSGLMVVGENAKTSEYNKDISYEQYETE